MRDRLPNRRIGEVYSFTHERIHYRGMVGFAITPELGRAELIHARRRPLEIFLHAGKPGSPVEAAARDAAVLASLNLQHGVPIETVRHSLTQGPDGSGAGPVGHLLDLVIADLAQADVPAPTASTAEDIAP
jgi:hypothetical protein